MKRARKVDIVALVCTLVLGFDRGAKRTVASLRRAYAMSTETTLAPSAFYDRFTPALAELMRELEDMPSGNKAVTECLLYASLLALALGRKLHRVLHARWQRTSLASRTIPTERWTTVLRALTPVLLELLLAPPRRRRSLERRLHRLIEREAPDPNRSRLLLTQRAQSGILRASLLAA